MPIAAILTNAGSQPSRPVLTHSACTSFSATPTPARFLSGIGAVVPLRIDDRQRRRQRRVGFVVIRDDQIEAERAACRAASSARMPQSTEMTSRTPSACRRSSAAGCSP